MSADAVHIIIHSSVHCLNYNVVIFIILTSKAVLITFFRLALADVQIDTKNVILVPFNKKPMRRNILISINSKPTTSNNL